MIGVIAQKLMREGVENFDFLLLGKHLVGLPPYVILWQPF